MILYTTPTPYGYILYNEFEKYVFNQSKQINSPVPYYLKQVEPKEQHISGMFKQKRKNEFRGKTTENARVILYLVNGIAILNIG